MEIAGQEAKTPGGGRGLSGPVNRERPPAGVDRKFVYEILFSSMFLAGAVHWREPGW